MNCSACRQDFSQNHMQLTPQGTWACVSCASRAMEATAQGASRVTYGRGMKMVAGSMFAGALYLFVNHPKGQGDEGMMIFLPSLVLLGLGGLLMIGGVVVSSEV